MLRSLKQMRSSSENKSSFKYQKSIIAILSHCKCKNVLNIIKLQKHQCIRLKKPLNEYQVFPATRNASPSHFPTIQPLPLFFYFYFLQKQKTDHNIYNFKSHKNVKQTNKKKEIPIQLSAKVRAYPFCAA